MSHLTLSLEGASEAENAAFKLRGDRGYEGFPPE